MNKYCSAALVTGVAVLSLTACSAGITAVSPPASRPATSPAAAASRGTATATGSLSAGTTVDLGGSIGNFPIPSGAKVVENVSYGKQVALILNSISPATVSGFYTSALPRAGYKITNHSLTTLNNGAGVAIEFTGHGYKGTIGAVSGSLASPAPSFGGDSKNLVGITLTKQ